MHFGEVDEISDEDLEATTDYYQCILNEALPHKQAERIASEHYGVVLDDTSSTVSCSYLPVPIGHWRIASDLA